MILKRPLVLIGLDAFEHTVLDRLVDEGRLPHIRALIHRGNYRRLAGEGPGLQGAVWRSFLTGRPLGDHGWFFRKLWRPETGRIEPASPTWLDATPFWKLLDKQLKVAVVDVPHATASPACGIHLDGWQTHDEATLYASPPSLLTEVQARFGKHAMAPERYGPQSPTSLRELGRMTSAAAEQIADIGSWLQQRDEFDLFVLVLGSPHRAGHYLWTLPGDEPASALPSEELLRVYAACDAAVGRLVQTAPDGATIGVFALHGMGMNPGWRDHFGAIVRLLHDGPRSGRMPGWRRGLHRLRRTGFAHSLNTLLPASVNHCIGRVWSRNMHDWPRTRFFTLPDEEHGCIRVNLRGREPQGIVESGDYERLLDRMHAALAGTVDLATGLPIAKSITRVDRFVDVRAPGRAYLPDLIVDWHPVPASTSPGVKVPGFGEVRWEPGGGVISGRSGAHTQDGWLVLCDPAVVEGSRSPPAPAISLVPSLLRGMNAEVLTGEPAGRTFVDLLDMASTRGGEGVRSVNSHQAFQLATPDDAEQHHKDKG